MSQRYISKELRLRVMMQARHRCGYCLTREDITGQSMEIDHIIPQSLGGSDDEDNLWSSCTLCNKHKSNRVNAIDPQTSKMVRLFDPRHQEWHQHFAWTTQGDRILGQTAIGRATVVTLKLNRPSLVRARQRWVEAGWHPPKD